MKYKRPSPRGGIYTRPHQELVMNELPFLEAQVKRIPRPARRIIIGVAIILALGSMVPGAAPDHYLPDFFAATDPDTGDRHANGRYILTVLPILALCAITLKKFTNPTSGRIDPNSKNAKASREQEVAEKFAWRILEKFYAAKKLGYTPKLSLAIHIFEKLFSSPEGRDPTESFLRYAKYSTATSEAHVQKSTRIQRSRTHYRMLEDNILKLSILEEEIDDFLRSHGIDPAAPHHSWNRPYRTTKDAKAAEERRRRENSPEAIAEREAKARRRASRDELRRKGAEYMRAQQRQEEES